MKKLILGIALICLLRFRQLARGALIALVSPQAGETRCRAQLPHLCALLARDPKRAEECGFAHGFIRDRLGH